MTFKLVKIVGALEVEVSTNFPTPEGAIEYGNEWLGDEEHAIQCEINAGNYEAAEYLTWFLVQDSSGAEVYRSLGA